MLDHGGHPDRRDDPESVSPSSLQVQFTYCLGSPIRVLSLIMQLR
jgi:hypothetical protein